MTEDIDNEINADNSLSKKKITEWTREKKLKLALACQAHAAHLKTKVNQTTKWTSVLLDIQKLKLFQDDNGICTLQVKNGEALKNAFLRFQSEELKDLTSPTVNLSGKSSMKDQYRLLMEQLHKETENERNKQEQKKIVQNMTDKRNKSLAEQTMLYSSHIGDSSNLNTSLLSSSSGNESSNTATTNTVNSGSSAPMPRQKSFMEQLETKLFTLLDDDLPAPSSVSSQLESEQLEGQRMDNDCKRLAKRKLEIEIAELERKQNKTD